MIIGALKELKKGENRAALTPSGAEVLTQQGHKVLVEKGAGAASGFTDQEYIQSGSEILESPKDIFTRAEMIVRVKEPQPEEYGRLKEGQIYFSYLHLPASKDVAKALKEAGTVNIAYETIQKDDGSLPLLKPMSEVAGPMAVQVGAKYLEMAQGGHGILLGGVPGVDPGTVVVLGGGIAGANAAKMACGLGAKVYILDINLDRLRHLDDVMPDNCTSLMSTPANNRELLTTADLVIGAVLRPGRKTPVLVDRDMLKTMKPGAVMVDISIDQGGCFETSRETSHDDPIFILDGIVHYAVSNMAGGVPKTGTMALTNATLPYILEIADKGWKKAMAENAEIRRGANIVNGVVTHQGAADVLGVECTPVESLL